MKHFLILLSALVLAQGLKQNEAISSHDAEELLGPLLNEYFELKNLIEEVKQYQGTQKISSLVLAEKIARVPPHCLPIDTPFIEAWDSDACNNLTESLQKAVSLAQQIGNWAYQAGLNLWAKFSDLFQCGNVNPLTAFKCVVNDINELKKVIESYKPRALAYKEKIVALAKELKVEFKQCLGVQKEAQAIAEQVVVQAQLCDNTKL